MKLLEMNAFFSFIESISLLATIDGISKFDIVISKVISDLIIL